MPFSVVMVDIDHFKEINDVYGHLKGDEIIREFAQFLKESLRKSDTVIRYGGDEFLCVMPQTTRHDTEWIYRRIIKMCGEKEFSGLKITLSVGVSSYPGDGQDFEELLKIADQALYNAKRSGQARLGIVRKKQLELPMKVFIDRIEEKEALKKLLMDGKERMSVAIVKGNVGIGKTRLGRQVLDDIRGCEIVWSDCLFLTDSIAYYPIREALKYHIQRFGIAVLQDLPLVYRLEIGKLIPELAEQIAEKPDGVAMVMDKYRLYESIRKVFEIGERKKVVVIDNIQWIDQESTEVIKYLMRSLRDNPILFMLIYRTEELTDILEEFLSYISREIEVSEIKLLPFKYPEIKESVKSIIGDEPGQELVEYVIRESGGISFYIEAIMRGLTDSNHLTVEEESWVFREPENEVVPKSLGNVAIRKYRSLSKEAQQVVDIASAVGWFDVEMIMKLTGYNECEIVGLLTTMNKIGLIKYKKERFEFSEEISRHALYKKNVEGIRAMELHRKVAEQLEERSEGREGEFVEFLAHHYYRAQDKEKGVRYCVEAGDRAKEQYANRYAIRYYTWALELLKDEKETDKTKTAIDCILKRAGVLNFIGENEAAFRDVEASLKKSRLLEDKKREADTLLMKAGIYSTISRYQESIAVAEQCVEMYQKIGDKAKIAQAFHTIGKTYADINEYDKAMKHFTRALKLYRESGEKRDEAFILSNIAWIYFTSDYQRALKYGEEALAIHKEIGDEGGEAKACGTTGGILSHLGDHQRALKYHEASLQLYRKLGNRLGEATTCGNIASVYDTVLGDYRKALRFSEESLKICRETGAKRAEAITLGNIAVHYSQVGEPQTALALSDKALEIAKEIDAKGVEAFALNQHGNIYANLGDYDKAHAFYERARTIIEKINIAWQKLNNLRSLAELYLTLNEPDKAKEFIDEAYATAKILNSKAMVCNCLGLLCEYYVEKGNIDEFQKTIKLFAGLGRELKTARHEGQQNFLLGRFYSITKEFEKAETHLRKALLVYEKTGMKMGVGVVYYYLAQIEFERGNKPLGKEYYDKSMEIFSSIGAKGWQAKVEKFLKEHF